MADDPPTLTAEKYKRGRPKADELRPMKLPTQPRRGRPTKAEAAERAKLIVSAAQKHADEISRRELERHRKAKLEQRRAADQGRDLRKAGGAVPDDPLEAASRLCRILIESGEKAMQDKSLSPAEQRAELRAIAKSVQALIPASRMLAAEKTMRDALEQMTRSASPPKTETPRAHVSSGAPMQMPMRTDG